MMFPRNNEWNGAETRKSWFEAKKRMDIRSMCLMHSWYALSDHVWELLEPHLPGREEEQMN